MEPIVIPDATREPLAYRDALLALLGDRDPVAVMAATPDRLRELLAGASPEETTARPAEGEWSAAELLGHLFDVELVFGFRWRLTLTADRPGYPGYDEQRWAALPRPPLPDLLDGWRALRSANLALLRATPRAEWTRVGVHGEQGPETFDVTVRKLAAHDLAHLDQLKRTLAAAR